jgi:hypothetical protein
MEKDAERMAKELEKSLAPQKLVSHRSRYGPYGPKDFFAFVEFVDNVVEMMNRYDANKKKSQPLAAVTEFKFMKRAEPRYDGYVGPDSDNLLIQKMFEMEKQRGEEAQLFIAVSTTLRKLFMTHSSSCAFWR